MTIASIPIASIPIRDALPALERLLRRPVGELSVTLAPDGAIAALQVGGRRLRVARRRRDPVLAAIDRWPAAFAAFFPRCVLRKVEIYGAVDLETGEPSGPPAPPEDPDALRRVERGLLRFALSCDQRPAHVTASWVGLCAPGSSMLVARDGADGIDRTIGRMPPGMEPDLLSALGGVGGVVMLDVPETASASGRLALRRHLEEGAG